MTTMSLLECFDGPFSRWREQPESWRPWRVFIKAITAQPLDDAELAFFQQCTGRSEPPASPVREAWGCIGRRGRKTATAAMVAVHAAVYVPWPRKPGETLRVLVVANTLDQARLVRAYAWALLDSLPGLRRLIVASDAETIGLSNGVEIKCVSNSFRSIRGPTVVCAVFDEVAFWFDEASANPDREIYRAVKPAMLTAPGSLLLGISSPYGKRGLLYEKHRDNYGRDGSKVLVWQADTQTMNPAVDAAEIEQGYKDDPVAAGADYGAMFRDALTTFLDADLLNTLTRSEPRELPPDGRRQYRAFCDPSGGRGDAFTCAIGHVEHGRAVVDVLRTWPPPFDPAAVTVQVAELLGSYGITQTVGDRYAASWCSEAFRAAGVQYGASPRDKSEIYVQSLVHFTRGEVQLPDDHRLIGELAGLERRTSRGGKDSVDHGRGRHDDRANACCGLILELLDQRQFEGSLVGATVLGAPSAVARHYEEEMRFGGAIDDRGMDWDAIEAEGNRLSPRTCRPKLGCGRMDWDFPGGWDETPW